MGTLTCQRCRATAEGNTQKEADDAIDHARGQMIGRPCSGKQSDLKWSGTTAPKREAPPEVAETSKSPEKKTKKSKRG